MRVLRKENKEAKEEKEWEKRHGQKKGLRVDE